MTYYPLIPPSYLFSYWIFVWAIIYIIVTYFCNFSGTPLPRIFGSINPTLILLVAFITNTEYLLKLILYGMDTSIVLKYSLVLMILKGIPLWLVWTWDIQLYRDLLLVVLLFVIYYIYLWYNQVDILSVYKDVVKSIENNEDRTPIEYLIAKYILNEA